MDKETARSLLLDYCENRLTASEHAAVRVLLDGDPELAEEAAELAATLVLLKLPAAVSPSVPAGFEIEVMKALERDAGYEGRRKMNQMVVPGFGRWLGRSVLWSTIAVIVTVGALLALAARGSDMPPVDDEPVRELVGALFRLIEGVLGALVMVGAAGAALIVLLLSLSSPEFRRRRGHLAPAFFSVAMLMFVSRATVSLFFGADYVDYEAEGSYEGFTGTGSVFNEVGTHLGEVGTRLGTEPSEYQSFSNPEDEPAAVAPSAFSTEEYSRIYENGYREVAHDPLSTFSIDVDTASFANVRRFLSSHRYPPADAVRIEELINYFSYDYPRPETTETPFSIITELSRAPWRDEHLLLHIGLQGYELADEALPPSNLVFLVDVSGSMNDAAKLPLLQKSLALLVRELRSEDRVALVVYAGAAGVVLQSTPGNEQRTIISAIERLQAGGSTAGAQGIELAYQIAEENFIPGGNNRVILATDGDFNVGVSSTGELVRMIEEQRSKGILLTVLGFGMGNYKDGRLEQLADKGNGNYAYIDSMREAKKVLVHDLRGTLFTIAKDVKIQVEFNPSHVHSYRLIGYENRVLNKEDFNDDAKDAGELGAGHSVTALYEIVPAGSASASRVDPLKYQQVVPSGGAEHQGELATVKLRYKLPEESQSRLVSKAVAPEPRPLGQTSSDFRFSAAVAEFGLMLRKSEHRGDASFESAYRLAQGARGEDLHGYRAELLGLIETAESLSGN